MNQIIQISKDELQGMMQETITNSISEALNDFHEKINGKSCYYRNEVAKRLHMGNATVQKLIDDRTLELTADGKKITRESVDAYLMANTTRRKPRGSNKAE